MPVADFVARKPDGRVVLVVEAKNKRKTTAQWAAQVRRNLMSHFALDAEYFLLATPDRLYFWLDGDSPELAPPSVEMDAVKVLEPYMRTVGIGGEDLSGSGFELVVSSWLSELLGVNETGIGAPYPAQLRDAGFFEAVRGSFLSHQPSR